MKKDGLYIYQTTKAIHILNWINYFDHFQFDSTYWDFYLAWRELFLSMFIGDCSNMDLFYDRFVQEHEARSITEVDLKDDLYAIVAVYRGGGGGGG